MVKIIAWITNPTKVGQPSLFAIGPTIEDNKLLTILYINGLNKINKRMVVYSVNLHLSLFDGSRSLSKWLIIYYKIINKSKFFIN
jgi:hypothetical protein